MMNDTQLYIYFAGCAFFVIGCFFYYLKSNKELLDKKKIIINIIMNIFFGIAFLCVILSFF